MQYQQQDNNYWRDLKIGGIDLKLYVEIYPHLFRKATVGEGHLSHSQDYNFVLMYQDYQVIIYRE